MINGKQTLIIFILLLSGVLGFGLSWYHYQSVVPEPAIPVMQTVHNPMSFLASLQGDPQAGKKIFKLYCATCHNPQPLIDVHAPLISDKKAWSIRRQLGLDALLKITQHGVGAMPARGGCFECSDEQLRMTIQYMLNKTQSP